MTDYMRKNSTHPFRIYDSNSWRANDTSDKRLAYLTLLTYNAYTTILGLCLVAYSGYLINKDNTPFAKLLMCVGSFMVAIGLLYFAFPYLFSSRVASGIWMAFNAILLCFTIACIVLSFLNKHSLYSEITGMDANYTNKRKNAGLFFLENRAFISAVTIIGTVFTFLAMAAFTYLWSTFDEREVKQHVAHVIRTLPPHLDVEMETNRAHHDVIVRDPRTVPSAVPVVPVVPVTTARY